MHSQTLNHMAGKVGLSLAILCCPIIMHAQAAEKLSPGAALLFSNTTDQATGKKVSSPLTAHQMNGIFKNTKWKIAPDKKNFIVDDACDDAQEPDVAVMDLNDDKKMEVAVFYGGTCLTGNTGTGFILYTQNAQGEYYRCMDDAGILDIQKTKTKGYKDIMLGGPGFDFPLYKWTGQKYQLSRTVHVK